MNDVRWFATLLFFACAGCAAMHTDETALRSGPPLPRGFGATEIRGCFQTSYDAASGTREFTIRATIEPDGTSLLIEGFERNPGTSEYDEWTMHEPVLGGVVERVVMRHGNDWYLALRTDTGEARIDRWQLEHVAGAYGSRRSIAATGIGVALVTPPTITSIEDGVYVMPKLRRRPTFVKRVIHRGLPLERIPHLTVDPDGRFLLAHVDLGDDYTELRRVSLLDLVGETVTLLDSKTVPMLTSAAGSCLLDHRELGRALLMQAEADTIHLWDRANDGDFERVELVSSYYSDLEYPYEAWSRSY